MSAQVIQVNGKRVLLASVAGHLQVPIRDIRTLDSCTYLRFTDLRIEVLSRNAVLCFGLPCFAKSRAVATQLHHITSHDRSAAKRPGKYLTYIQHIYIAKTPVPRLWRAVGSRKNLTLPYSYFFGTLLFTYLSIITICHEIARLYSNQPLNSSPDSCLATSFLLSFLPWFGYQ